MLSVCLLSQTAIKTIIKKIGSCFTLRTYFILSARGRKESKCQVQASFDTGGENSTHLAGKLFSYVN